MMTSFLNDTAMDRFQNMHHTSRVVKSELLTFNSLSVNANFSVKAISFLDQKISNKPIRAYFVSKISELLLHERKTFSWRKEAVCNKLLHAQLPFIFETIITIQYLHNQILDAKAGVVSRDRIAENLLSANLLKEQLYRYIQQELPSWAREKVERSVRRCFEYVDMGQMLEIHANRYTSFISKNTVLNDVLPSSILENIKLEGVHPFINKLKADLPVFLHEPLTIYFHRIYLTCAALFVEATALIGDLLQVPSRKLKPLLQFSTTYGLMRQLVNDNADWIPADYELITKDKTSFDGFSDLRNGTLTLPLIFFLADQKNSCLHDVLDKQVEWKASMGQKVFNRMIDSNALYQSIQNTRILGELALAYLPQGIKAANYLADSCGIVHWNKFLAPCLKHSSYKLYRKTSTYKQTKRLIKELRRQRKLDQKELKGIHSGQLLHIPKCNTSPVIIQHLHQVINREMDSRYVIRV